ncbi:MAG: hypothetical protein ACOC2N_01665 [Spirochaetota bacterium]
MAAEKRYVFGAREFWLWQYRPRQDSTGACWYAMWRDEAGKKRRKSLRTHNRQVAEARLPELVAQLDAERRPTFAQYADRILDEGDEYLRQRGLAEQTIYAKRRCIRILCEIVGSDLLGETREANIEKMLRHSDYSAAYQSEIMDAYTFVMRRAERDGYPVRIPHFYRPDRNSKRRDSLTPTEVRALFPDDVESIRRLYDEDDGYGVMFGLLYRTIVHAGLRPGEGRAIGRDQFFREHKALVVSRRLDRYNEVRELKKRKYGDTDIYRIVPLPSRTCELLSWWIDTTEPADFLFVYQGEPVRQRYISERWARALGRARIEDKPLQLDGRRLDVQALRVTYRSMTEGWLPRSFLLDSMGHRSPDVHDGYLRFLERQVAAAGESAPEVDRVWAMPEDRTP